MIIFVAGGWSTSSQTLVYRLEDFYKTRSYDLKSGGGVGQLSIRVKTLKLLKLKFYNKIGKNLIFSQHLFPTKNALDLLDSWFGLDNIKFIVTYRNIFDTINNLLKKKEEVNSFQFLRSKFYPTYENFDISKYGINILDALMLVNFYAMWFKVEKENYIKNLQFISFDENTRDIETVNLKLSKFLGKEIKLKDGLSGQIYKKKQFELKENLKIFLKEYSESFVDIDFTRIGL